MAESGQMDSLVNSVAINRSVTRNKRVHCSFNEYSTSPETSPDEISAKRKREFTPVPRESFELPAYLREYLVYLGHDIGDQNKVLVHRKTPKSRFKCQCIRCGSIIYGHDNTRLRTGLQHLKQDHGVLESVDSKGNIIAIDFEKYPFNHSGQRTFSTFILLFMATSGAAMATLENKWLWEAFNFLQPCIRRVTRNYLGASLRVSANLKVLPFLRWLFGSSRYVSVIVDAWSTKRKDTIIGVQICFLDANMNYVRKTISVLKFVGRHTAPHIRSCVLGELSLYNLTSQIRYFVTDGGANMLAAFGPVIHSHFPNQKISNNRCTAHLLNNILRKSVNQAVLVNDYLSRMVNQVKYIRRSQVLHDAFKDDCGVTLVRVCLTRWNSYHDCLKRFLLPTVQRATVKVLGIHVKSRGPIYVPPPVPFTTAEYEDLASIYRFLDPMAQASKALQSDTLQATEIITIVTGVHTQLANEFGAGLLDNFRTNIMKLLVQTFKPIMTEPLVLFATFLNPRMQNLFFDTYRRDTNNEFGLPSGDEIIDMFSARYPQTASIQEIHQDTRGGTKSIMTVWDQRVDDVRQDRTPQCLSELTRFLRQPGFHPPTDESIAHFVRDYWISHRNIFPALYEAALEVYSYVSSTATVERLFSKLGCLDTPRRNNIKAITMQRIIQIKENCDIFGKYSTNPEIMTWLSLNGSKQQTQGTDILSVESEVGSEVVSDDDDVYDLLDILPDDKDGEMQETVEGCGSEEEFDFMEEDVVTGSDALGYAFQLN